MQHVRQRTATDCGVAALAMACGVTYEQAFDAIFPTNGKRRRRKRVFRTTTRHLREAAHRLGFKTTHRLRKWEEDLLSDRAIVKVNPVKQTWHWMVVEVKAGRCKWYDPALPTGEAPPPQRVCAYLPIEKRQ